MALAPNPVKLKVNTLENTKDVYNTNYTEQTLVLDISSLSAGSYEGTIEMLNEQCHSAFNIKELIVEVE